MPEVKTLGAIIGALKSELTPDCATIAISIGVRRQFIYALRDNAPELPRDENRAIVATAAEDPRYRAVDALCTARGITGFLEAVDAVRRKQQDPKFDDLREALRAWRAFGTVLSHEGADNSVLADPEVGRLYMELGIRLRALQNS